MFPAKLTVLVYFIEVAISRARSKKKIRRNVDDLLIMNRSYNRQIYIIILHGYILRS